MNTSDHGMSHLFNITEVDENGLIGIKSVFVKYLFIFNGS